MYDVCTERKEVVLSSTVLYIRRHKAEEFKLGRDSRPSKQRRLVEKMKHAVSDGGSGTLS